MNVRELAEAARKAIETALQPLSVTCLVEQWCTESLNDETVVVRVLNVPRQELTAAEDCAYGVAQAIVPDDDLPFGIVTHPAEDSAMGGVFYEALIQERLRRGDYELLVAGAPGQDWEVFVQSSSAPLPPRLLAA